ncbi:GroES-like protein [Cladochytrium replicatum]|nr:GroES-like protein [Cladochytrium replicatum]
MPSHKAAVIPAKEVKNVIEDVPTPTPGPQEVLIKIEVAATNPVDWKAGKYGVFIPGFPYILGVDGAGIVFETGAGVTRVKKGDRVAVFSTIVDKRYNTYQEYALANPEVAFRIPENISFEQGSTVPLGFFTGVDLLYLALGFPLPDAKASRFTPLKPDAETVLVWGAASSVGQYTVQLARLSNLRVVATASAHNFDLIRSLGASEVFDYKDPDVIAKIKAVAPNLQYGIDTVDLDGSSDKIVQSIGPDGGEVSTALSARPSARPEVKITSVFAGKVHNLDGKNAHAAQVGQALVNFAEEWLKTGEIVPNKTLVVPGGLSGIDEGWALNSKGVSAVKILIKVEAAATNPADWKIGKYGIFISGFPFILDLDGTSTVVETSVNVTYVKKGDRVAVFSTLCDKQTNMYQE